MTTSAEFIYPNLPTCPHCGAEMEPDDCWVCGGDGVLAGDEFDPINYSPYEEVECAACGGTGEMGWRCPFCDND